MINRSLHKDSCNEVIELALRIPETQVVAFGPESCLRVLFFRAARTELLDRFNMVFTKDIDLVTNNHLEALKDSLETIIEESKNQSDMIQTLIVYISCADILMGTNFNSITRHIEKKYQIPVKIFQRGPLSRRKMLPKERLSIIFAEIEEFYQRKDNRPHEQENALNILGEEKILPGSSLSRMIHKANFTQLNDLSDLKSFEQFLSMARSRLSIVTHPFALSFAKYLKEKYQIHYLYLPRSRNRQESKWRHQQLAEFLQVEDDYLLIEQAFKDYLDKIPKEAFRKKIAIGLPEESLEMALALLELGFDVRVIFLDSISADEEERLEKFSEKGEIIVYTNSHLLEILDKPQDIEVAIGEYAINYFPKGRRVEYLGQYDIAFENIKRLIGEII